MREEEVSSNTTLIAFSLLVLTSNFSIVGQARADNAVKKCNAVISYAQIEYPTRLIVNVAKDELEQWCRFSVSLPPTGLSVGKATASLFLKNAITSKQYSQFVIQPIIGALPDNRVQEKKILSDIIRKNKKRVIECFQQFIKGLRDFRRNLSGDNLSCYSLEGSLGIRTQLNELSATAFYHEDFFM